MNWLSLNDVDECHPKGYNLDKHIGDGFAVYNKEGEVPNYLNTKFVDQNFPCDDTY